jgi:hypothetical protein
MDSKRPPSGTRRGGSQLVSASYSVEVAHNIFNHVPMDDQAIEKFQKDVARYKSWTVFLRILRRRCMPVYAVKRSNT